MLPIRFGSKKSPHFQKVMEIQWCQIENQQSPLSIEVLNIDFGQEAAKISGVKVGG